jgi:hypothetical protein
VNLSSVYAYRVFFGLIFAVLSIKSNAMKKILLGTIYFLCFIFTGYSQTIYVTDTESWADITVYVTETEAWADLVVYKESTESWATGNRGRWYFTETESWADKTIYFTDTESWADLVIYFTDTEAWAGWKDKSKMHLLE